MIIGKIGRVCVLVLLLCVGLCSCQRGSAPEIPLELLRENLPNEDEEKQYCIVIPDGSSADRLEIAQALAGKIGQRINREIECFYEHEAPFAQKETFFLFVGWIRSVDACDRLMKNLKKDDYLCRSVEQGICLGGKSDEATRAAVDRFCGEILPAATATSLMHPDGGFSQIGETYAVDSIRLNGFDLHTYGIVYPDDASEELVRLAYALRDRIADASGYWLDVCAEKKMDEEERGIWIGTADPPQTSTSAYLVPTARDVLLTGWEFFGISAAARSFCSLLLQENNTQIDVAITETQAFSYDHASYSLMSIVPEGVLPFLSPADVQAVSDRIQLDAPSAVLLGRMPTEQSQYLTGSLSAYTPIRGMSASMADLTAYSQGGKLSFLDAWEAEDGSWTVSVFWMGTQWSGFQVVQISGSFNKDEAWRLSEMEIDWNEPTVIVVHTRLLGGSLSISDLEDHRMSAVLSERYTKSDVPYFFACYATTDTLRVQARESEGVYRKLVAERLSAF